MRPTVFRSLLTTSASTSRIPASTFKPTLQHFILRAEALKAYRSAVRATRPLPDSMTRRETLDFLRIDLERMRGVTDLQTMKERLGDFRRTMNNFLPGMDLIALDDLKLEGRLIGQKKNQGDLLKRRFME